MYAWTPPFISACAKIQWRHHKSQYISSLGNIPPPQSLDVSKINSTAMFVQWDPIPKENVSGILLGYLVTITSSSNVLLQQQRTSDTRILISFAKIGVTNRVFVQGYTATEKGRHQANEHWFTFGE